MATPEPTSSLTEEQVSYFHEQGYLAIDAITTPEEVARLCEIYDRLIEQRAGWDEGNHFDLGGAEDGTEAVLPQILNPAKYAPELNDTLLLANGRRMLQQLVGPETTCAIAHAIYKPARVGPETPWHQDAAYWAPTHYQKSVSIWVPLQPVDERSGCMQFVPGSHKYDVLTHQSINNDPRVHGLELVPQERYNVANPAICPLPAGGATFHGGYMLHYTGPNRSDVPRRAIILMGGVPGTPRVLPRRYWWIEQRQTPRAARAARAG